MNQINFWEKSSDSHGGQPSVGKRKGARVIQVKQPMHLTFKASRARGEWSLLKKEREVRELVYKTAERFNVRVRMYQNVGNHLHLVAEAKKRFLFQSFLRVLPQKVMFLVTGARKGNPQGKFWDGLVHSRVVHWGKDYDGIRGYFYKNKAEAAGVPRDVLDAWIRGNRRAWESMVQQNIVQRL